MHRFSRPSLWLALGLAWPGCGDDDKQAEGVRGTTPAVMVSVISSNPDERLTYVGAFPNVPSGEVRTNNMLEFGDAYFYGYDGSIFAWEREKSSVTRFEVTDDYKLIKGKTVSFQSYGFKYDAELTFVTPTRAYMFVTGQSLVIVWNPSTMEVSGTFPANLPAREGLDTFPVAIGVAGNRMHWAFISSNYDALKVYPKNVLGVASTETNDPVTSIEDGRCIPSLGGYISSAGDIYLAGGADADVMSAYNPQAAYPPSCVLRVKAGSSSFDPDYFIDLHKVLDTPAIPGHWRIDDNTLLVLMWDKALPLPATYDEFWSSKTFISKKLDLTTGAVSDFPGFQRVGFSSNIQDRVDGVTYLSIPRDDGSADVAYRLKPDGIEEAFSLPGAGYWGMARLR